MPSSLGWKRFEFGFYSLPASIVFVLCSRIGLGILLFFFKSGMDDLQNWFHGLILYGGRVVRLEFGFLSFIP